MDTKTLAAAQAYSESLLAGVLSGIKNHIVSGTTLIFEFSDGSSASMTFNQPKNGADGKDATPEQILQAVTEYLNAHPVQGGVDKQQIESIVKEYLEEHGVENATETKMLSHIVATKDKTTYNVDDNISLDDLVVTAYYTDNTQKEIDNYTTDIDTIDTSTDGYRKLTITYVYNGICKTTEIPLKILLSNTCDGIQYGYCVANHGDILPEIPLLTLRNKLFQNSTLNIRMKIKLTITKNNNPSSTKLCISNNELFGTRTFGNVNIPAYEVGDYILSCNDNFTFEHNNYSPEDKPFLTLIHDGGTSINGNFEVIGYSITVTSKAPILLSNITAQKQQTRFIIGEHIKVDDIIVTAYLTDDTSYVVNPDEIICDVDGLDTTSGGRKQLCVSYNRNNVEKTAEITLKMFEPLLTEAQPFIDMDVFEYANAWNMGTNIGNCLDVRFSTTSDLVSRKNVIAKYCVYDGHPEQETLWGQPEIIRQNFKDIKAKGFDLVRVPVTWCYNSIEDENGEWKIGKYWLARINEVVKMAIEEGLYIMINTHHDQPIFYTGVTNTEAERVYKRCKEIWYQIADTLKHYDHHLMFESYNEIDNIGSTTDLTKAYAQLNQMNQVFVDTVRSAGSNNAKRILIVPTKFHGISNDNFANFIMPQDTVQNHIMIAVHPYSNKCYQDIEGIMGRMEKWSTYHNAPIVATEWGIQHREDALPFGLKQASAYLSNYMARAKYHNIKTIWWDNGSDYTLILRNNRTIDYGYAEEQLDVWVNAIHEGYNTGNASYVSEDKIYSLNRMDVHFDYGRLNLSTGDVSYASWSDFTTKLLPVIEGDSVSVSLVSGSEAEKHKLAIAQVMIVDQEGEPIKTISCSYMQTTVAFTAPEDACGMKICCNSPHYNISKSVISQLMDNDSLSLDILCYKYTDIKQTIIPEKELTAITYNDDYSLTYTNGHINTDNLSVIAVYNDGYYQKEIFNYTIDTSVLEDNMTSFEKFDCDLDLVYEENGKRYTEVLHFSYDPSVERSWIWDGTTETFDSDIECTKSEYSLTANNGTYYLDSQANGTPVIYLGKERYLSSKFKFEMKYYCASYFDDASIALPIKVGDDGINRVLYLYMNPSTGKWEARGQKTLALSSDSPNKIDTIKVEAVGNSDIIARVTIGSNVFDICDESYLSATNDFWRPRIWMKNRYRLYSVSYISYV